MKSAQKPRFLVLIPFFAFAASLFCCVSSSAAPPYDQQVIWMRAQGAPGVMFIPERFLNEHEIKDLPLNTGDRADFEGALEAEKSVEGYRKRTGRQDEPLCPHARIQIRADAVALRELLRREPLSFLATVEDVVPGYDFWRRSAVNMIYLRPEIPLRGAITAPNGSPLAYSEPWGSITVRGRQTCWQPPPGVYRARKGDRVLVIGSELESNPIALRYGYLFPVVDNEVQYRLYGDIQDFKSISIDDLQRNTGAHL